MSQTLASCDPSFCVTLCKLNQAQAQAQAKCVQCVDFNTQDDYSYHDPFTILTI